MIQDLAPLLGRRLSFGVVPNWHGEWPLAAHPDYCRLLRESSEELLLHGYFHRRQRGWGPTTLFAESSDEMNGLDPEETRRTLERGQRVFAEVFGAPARGFLAPGWQRGHVRPGNRNAFGLEHVLGFFSLDSRRPEGSPGDVDLGLRSLGLARTHRSWDRMAALSRWIVESLRWRFTREIWSGVSGRRSSGSQGSSSRVGTNRAHRRRCSMGRLKPALTHHEHPHRHLARSGSCRPVAREGAGVHLRVCPVAGHRHGARHRDSVRLADIHDASAER